MKIKIKEDLVYRGKKLIATIDGDEIKFKHHAYKKHREEIESLLEPVADIGLEPMPSTPVDDATDAPIEFSLTAHGKRMGEETPEIVVWRQNNWSPEKYSISGLSLTTLLATGSYGKP